MPKIEQKLFSHTKIIIVDYTEKYSCSHRNTFKPNINCGNEFEPFFFKVKFYLTLKIKQPRGLYKPRLHTYSVGWHKSHDLSGFVFASLAHFIGLN